MKQSILQLKELFERKKEIFLKLREFVRPFSELAEGAAKPSDVGHQLAILSEKHFDEKKGLLPLLDSLVIINNQLINFQNWPGEGILVKWQREMMGFVSKENHFLIVKYKPRLLEIMYDKDPRTRWLENFETFKDLITVIKMELTYFSLMLQSYVKFTIYVIINFLYRKQFGDALKSVKAEKPILGERQAKFFTGLIKNIIKKKYGEAERLVEENRESLEQDELAAMDKVFPKEKSEFMKGAITSSGLRRKASLAALGIATAGGIYYGIENIPKTPNLPYSKKPVAAGISQSRKDTSEHLIKTEIVMPDTSAKKPNIPVQPRGRAIIGVHGVIDRLNTATKNWIYEMLSIDKLSEYQLDLIRNEGIELHFYPGNKKVVAITSKDEPIFSFNAVGGPPKSGRGYYRTPQGTYTTYSRPTEHHPDYSSHKYTRIRWGARIKEENGRIYVNEGDRWKDARKLGLEKSDFYDEHGNLIREWDKNLFGRLSLYLKDSRGRQTKFWLHTTANTMKHPVESMSSTKPHGEYSHACIRIGPVEMAKLLQSLEANREGIKFVVHGYDERIPDEGLVAMK